MINKNSKMYVCYFICFLISLTSLAVNSAENLGESFKSDSIKISNDMIQINKEAYREIASIKSSPEISGESSKDNYKDEYIEADQSEDVKNLQKLDASSGVEFWKSEN